jgi:hypothetical protein
MKRFLPLTLAILVVCVAATVAVLSLPPGAERSTASVSAGEPAAHSAGLMIHIDPATGKIVEPWPNDAPVVLNEKLSDALSTSSEGLHEVASPVAGGGVMVYLQGRFQQTMAATTDEDGNLSTTCGSTGEHASESGEE